MPRLSDLAGLEGSFKAGIQEKERTISTSPTKYEGMFEAMRSLNETQDIKDDGRTMWDELGGFTSQLGYSAIDTALFGTVSAFTPLQIDPPESTIEKVGQAIGTAAGFLPPMKLVGGALRYGVSNLSKYGASRIQKKLLADSGKLLKNAKGTKIIDDVVYKGSKDDIWKTINEESIKPLYGQRLSRFGQEYKSVTSKKDFMSRLHDNVGKEIGRQSEMLGLQITKGTQRKLTDLFAKTFTTGKYPVATVQQRFARFFGDGKKASFFGHLFEEALMFSGVESIMHTVNVLGEKEPYYDYASVITHASMIGGLLGITRMVPGGARGGSFGGMFSANMKDRMGKLLGKKGTFAQRYDLSRTGGRDAVSEQYNYFAGITESLGKKQHVPVNSILADYAESHPLYRALATKSGKGGISTGSNNSLRRVLREGTKEEQRDAATIMADGLDVLHAHVRTAWRKDFMSFWWKDLKGSAGRMGIGGLAMSGGGGVLTDPNAEWDDKLIAFMTGAFITKGGKSLQFYKPTGSKYPTQQFEITKEPIFGFFGKESPYAFSDRLSQQGRLIDALGGDVTDPVHQMFMFRVSQAPQPAHKPEETAQLKQNRELSVPFLKKEGNILKSKPETKTGPDSEIQRLYNEWLNANSNDVVLPEGKEFKNWDELTPRQRKDFEKMLEEQGIGDISDIHEPYVKANLKTWSEIEQTSILHLLEAAEVIAPGEAAVRDADGRLFLRKISMDNPASFSNEGKEAVREYNNAIDMLETHSAIGGVIRSKAGEIKLSANDPRMEGFISEIKSTVENLNRLAGIDVEAGVQIRFDDPHFNSLHKLHHIRMSIERTVDMLPKWIKSESSSLEPQDARAHELIQELFFTNEGAIYDKVNVSGKDYSLRNFINSLKEVIDYHGATNDAIVGFQSTRTNEANLKSIRELKRIFEDNGIDGFSQDSGMIRRDYADQVNKSFIKRLIAKRQIIDPKTGKLRNLTGEDVLKVRRLIDAGMANNKLTLKGIGGVFSLTSRLTVLDVLGAKDTESIRLRDENLSPKEAAILKRTYDEAAKILGDGNMKTGGAKLQEMVTEYQNLVGHLIRDVKDGVETGIFHKSVDQVGIFDKLMLLTLNNSLKHAMNKTMPRDAERMFEAMKRDDNLADSEYSMMSKFVLNEFSRNNADSIHLYQLMVEQGLWKPEVAEFATLPQTELKARMDALVRQVVGKTGASKEQINAIMKSYQDADLREGSGHGFRTVTIDSFIKEYKLSSEYASDKHTPGQKLSNEYYADLSEGKSNLDFSNKLRDKAVAAMKESTGKDMNTKDKEKLEARIVKLMLDLKGQIGVLKITADSGSRKNWTYENEAMKESHVMRHLNEILADRGLDGKLLTPISGKRQAKIVIFDKSIRTGKGRAVKNLLDGATDGMTVMEELSRRAWAIGGEAVDGSILWESKFKNISKLGFQPSPYIVYRYALNDWAYGISKADVPKVYKAYTEFILKAKSKGLIQDVAPYFNASGMIKGKKWEVNDASLTRENLQRNVPRMLNEMIWGQWLGNRWFSEVRNLQGAEAAKFLKRAKLLNNIAGNRLSKEFLNESAKFIESSDSIQNKKSISAMLDRLASSKSKQVVFRDETDDGVIPIFSVRDGSGKGDYDRNIELAKGTKYEGLLQEAKLERESALGKDASSVNSVQVVRPEMFDALAFVNSGLAGDGIGGIKPIILRYDGKDVFVVEKTAFIKDSSLDGFFGNNPDVDFVSFTSTSKQIGGKYDGKYNSKIYDLTEGGWETVSSKKMEKGWHHTMRPQDINLIQVKGNKGYATTAPNSTSNFKSKTALQSHYQEYSSDAVDRTRSKLSAHNDADSYMETIAEYRYLSEKGIDDLHQIGQLSVNQRLSQAGAMPQFMPRQWHNLIKKEYIDPLIRIKIKDGGQGVLAPDITIGEANSLKETVLYKDGDRSRVFSYGEVEVSGLAREKGFDPTQTWLIKTNSKDVDGLKSVSNSIKAKDLLPLNDIGKLHDYVKKNMPDHQIAIVVERNPHTKPDSAIILGLRGFADSKDGNVIRVNAGDVKRALEGDYDIDIANFWWKTPKSVMKEYQDLRGITTDSAVEPVGADNASYSRLSLNDPRSIDKYAEHLKSSEYMRGSIMNLQRMVQWFSHTPSNMTFTNKGLKNAPIFKIGDNKYARFEVENIDGMSKKLATMNQEMLDSENGFNVVKYRRDIMEDNFWFGEDGAFQIYTRDGTRLEKSSGTLKADEITIIKGVLSPYRRLMSLANSIYEGGIQKKVDLDSLVSGIRLFDTEMRWAENNIWRKISNDTKKAIRKGYKGKDVLIYNGFNTNARLLERGGMNAVKGLLPYERILGEIASMEAFHLNTDFQNRHSQFYGEVAEHGTLMLSGKSFTEGMDALMKGVKSHTDLGMRSNWAAQQILNLRRLKFQMRHDNGMSVALAKRIKGLESYKDYLVKNSDAIFWDVGTTTGKDGKKRPYRKLTSMGKRIQKHWVRKIYMDFSKRGQDPPPFRSVVKMALREMKDKGLRIEGVTSKEQLVGLASFDAFGEFAYTEYVGKGGGWDFDAKNLSNRVFEWRREYLKEWAKHLQGKGDKINENHIYEEHLGRLEDIMMEAQDPALMMLLLGKVMVPKMDMSKMVYYRGKLMPYTGGNSQSLINIGLRWLNNTKMITEGQKNIAFERIADSFNRSWLKLNGVNESIFGKGVTALGLKQTAEAGDYVDPFLYSDGHTMSALMSVLNPQVEHLIGNRSRLGQYDILNQVWGQGLIKHVITKTNLTTMPAGAATAMSRFGKHYAINGYKDFLKAYEYEMTALIGDKRAKNTYVEKNMSDFDILYDNGETGSARNLVRRAKKGEAYDNCK